MSRGKNEVKLLGKIDKSANINGSHRLMICSISRMIIKLASKRNCI